MGTRPPGLAKISVAVLFTLSCIGLLLFLWNSFGGTVPLQPKGYRATLVLPDASNIVKETEVRVSGVRIGNVVKTSRVGATTHAILQIDPRYAPLRQDVRAVVRRKSLLGEAYVELTPGSPKAAAIPEDGVIPARQVQEEQAVDKVLSTFDPRTRKALQGWLAGWAAGLRDRGADLSAGLGQLPGATQASGDLLSELRRQRAAVTRLVHDTGVTFQTIGSQRADIDRLIDNSQQLFATTAASERGLRGTLAALPGFLDGLKNSSGAVTRISSPLTPVLADLRPAARALPTTLRAATTAGAELRRIAAPLDAVTRVAPKGLTAGSSIVRSLGPLMSQLRPLGRQLLPIVQFTTLYRQEAIQSWLQPAAATQAVLPNQEGTPIHYLRAPAIFANEALVGQAVKEPYSRSNPYMAPLGIDNLGRGGLKTFSCGNTGNRSSVPALGPAVPCRAQGPIAFQGRVTSYPQVQQAP